MSTVIGLGYAARSGKDTAAAAIIEARGGEFDIRRYAFADELKKEVNAYAQTLGSMYALYQHVMFKNQRANITWDGDPDMSDPLCPLGKQRSLLQWWGTEYRRKQDPFYWVRMMKAQLEIDKPQFAIITDVRFDNELYFIKSLGGHTVKVTRQGITASDLSIRQHRSETELINAAFDYEIVAPYDGLHELKSDAIALFDLIVDGMRSQDDAFGELVYATTPTYQEAV